MYDFNDNPDIFNQVIRLSKEQKEQPFSVIKFFHSAYHLSEARQHIWDMFQAAITSEEGDYQEVQQKVKLIDFCKHLEQLIEACYVLDQQDK